MTGTADRRLSIQWRAGGLGLSLLVTVAIFVLGYAEKARCQLGGWPSPRDIPVNQFCYSDIPVLFSSRGLIEGIFPYAPQPWTHPLEYPVLTGIVMDLTARLSRTLNPNADTPSAMQTYFNVNVVVLLAFALVAVAGVWALLRRTGGRRSDALLFAGAPTLALAGTINWDLVVVAMAVLALLAWAYDRPLLAGVLIGLGTATKLYPVFILGAVFLLCLRQRRLPTFWRTTLAAVVAWLAVNVPLAVVYPAGWLEFFRFNAGRGPDFGAIWYALALAGYPVPALNVVAPLSFVLLCAGIGFLAWRAPRMPTIEQLAFLVVTAFLLTNKVYSPQYVLWMLPLAVLARGNVPFPRALREFALWQAAEVLYWAAVWAYLIERIYDTYILAIVVRAVVTCWYAWQVVDDIRTAPAAGPPAAAAGGAVRAGEPRYAAAGAEPVPVPSGEATAH